MFEPRRMLAIRPVGQSVHSHNGIISIVNINHFEAARRTIQNASIDADHVRTFVGTRVTPPLHIISGTNKTQ